MANEKPNTTGLIPWRPGESGNPLGVKIAVRMQQMIRERTGDGAAMLDFLAGVLRGEVTETVVTSKGVKTTKPPSIADRHRATEILLSYFAGKPRDSSVLAAAMAEAQARATPVGPDMISPQDALAACTDEELSGIEERLAAGATRAADRKRAAAQRTDHVGADGRGESPPPAGTLVVVVPSPTD